MKSITKFIFILCAGIFLSGERNANAQTITFNYTGSAQTWTVPCGVSSVTISCYGAQGGSCDASVPGGLGAKMVGTFAVVPAQVLTVVVGGQGVSAVPNPGSGGGGGSGVVYSGTPWIIAGGGAGLNNGGYPSINATTSNNGQAGQGNANGGTAGGDGGSVVYNVSNIAYGGRGFNSGNSGSAGQNGVSGLTTHTNGSWGLGGGGGGVGASDCNCGGGGGGYSGGGAGGINGDGGGGGSYNIGSSQTNTAGVQSGNGQVVLNWTAVIAPPPLVVGNVVSNVTCHGDNNGSASETIIGGTSPFSYLWTPTAQTNSIATGLTAGTYTIKITDACGNTATSSVSITQPAVVTVTTTVTNNVSCNAGNNGSVSSTVSGGTGAYTYSWTGGGTNSSVSGLTVGTYTLTVTDHNGCTGTASATITQPTALSVSASTTTNVLCNGANTGSASSTVSGGTTSYTYAWTGGGTNSTVTGLTAGTYTLTVTDANGCTGTASATITQPIVLTVFVDSITHGTNVLCNGGNNGSATSSVSGGITPYVYLWTGGGTNSSVSGLTAGTYTLTVTDANGCTATATATITQPAAISLAHSSTPDNGSGNGTATVTASGGTSPYNYLWTPSGKTTAVITNEVHGTYCCKVTDANGCKDSVCVTINKGTGIDGITSNSSQITVYPNPNNGQFTIKSSVGGASTVEIYNVLGEKVFTKSLSTTEGTNTIDISNQSTGVYLYRVISVTGDLLGEGKISLQK